MGQDTRLYITLDKVGVKQLERINKEKMKEVRAHPARILVSSDYDNEVEKAIDWELVGDVRGRNNFSTIALPHSAFYGMYSPVTVPKIGEYMREVANEVREGVVNWADLVLVEKLASILVEYFDGDEKDYPYLFVEFSY